MKKPVIGISGNEYKTGDHTEPLLSYTQTCLVQAIEDAGGLPLILPATEPDLAKYYIHLIDKLILTGGQNVQPSYYHEERTIDSDNYLPKRDEFELALIRAAQENQKPIFGICRGLQLYNVAQGGSLHQSISEHWQDIDGQEVSQTIQLTQNSPLYDIYESDPSVNSFHRQAIKDLAPDLEIIALSDNQQIIEAVHSAYPTKFLGVQWHPELLYGKRKIKKELFHYIVNKL
ncbi:gamma-glutamyl-gamma-aminobutyrate hydrolase family protein [Streptococcus suis]|nr:gamma-glutamyl-gamma-aminobutyrate hydrolase family protein [Streptococcus suis]NQQ71191.1 gamma-glutamyl-gamma-aminobutyrate hydrolase family protein [Streptococcus suis]HEM5582525.1 gamma-glutamyl-gamma-aminobutyrate hydrolase family protein [Streptococcus suis]